ncbi:MAG: type III-A CRISPR-associated protein Cas10/Csm1 [Eubacteriaceae bacterium]
MREQTLTVTIGCLLRDLDQIGIRSGDSRITENLRKQIVRLSGSGLTECADSPCNEAGLIEMAAEITSAGKDTDHSQKASVPLLSVFTRLNGNHPGHYISPYCENNEIPMPVIKAETKISEKDYVRIANILLKHLPEIPKDEKWISNLTTLLETALSSVPYRTDSADEQDLSFYDHLKITAAVGSCLAEYAAGQSDSQKESGINSDELKNIGAFILYSADFSGIQNFIYTVSTEKAMRTLRSHSFFLELLMEHYLDELLNACGVSRANLLYSGGGHCYVLLPNTRNTVTALTNWNKRFNDWMSSQFGPELYLADGFTVCTAEELFNLSPGTDQYKQMFRRVSRATAEKKNARYNADQLRGLNNGKEDDGRECKVCGRPAVHDEERQTCFWCGLFVRLSKDIQTNDLITVQTVIDKNAQKNKNSGFILPGAEEERHFRFINNQELQKYKNGNDFIRCYSKNKTIYEYPGMIRLNVGDYSADNLLENLAESSKGIKRIAVCRMDVDNLGQSFVAGFEQDTAKPDQKNQFVSLLRTTAFSRQMSLFFKSYINLLMKEKDSDGEPLQVSIVYSGGDDIFIVGSWDDAIEAAQRIQKALNEFACGAVTISGGIGIYSDHYPMRLTAEETEVLEDAAKGRPEKNSIALFEAKDENVYSWSDFNNKVVKEKTGLLKKFFSFSDNDRGTAFLYRILDLLRSAGTDRLQLARYAYLLARLEPLATGKGKTDYQEFAGHMYDWALNREDRRQIITAIYLFVYSNRNSQR